jgi:hypothetical protein
MLSCVKLDRRFAQSDLLKAISTVKQGVVRGFAAKERLLEDNALSLKRDLRGIVERIF